MLTPVRMTEDGLSLIDQRKLPHEETWITCRTVPQVADAIREMVVRGAPAIGCTAAYGMLIGARVASENAASAEALLNQLRADGETLNAARPTAVNLRWAVERMLGVAQQGADAGQSTHEIIGRLATEADAIYDEDVEANRTMGNLGQMFLPDGARVLTHCNAGALATSAIGTALGVIRAAVENGKSITVLADETRPFLQGARLTAWELMKDDIPVELITDSMAGAMMARGEVDVVVVGSDRIAANGDVANKIGTYTVAVLARRHGIPFYVAAPTSTIDMDCPSGDEIPIEERDPAEVVEVLGISIAPEGVRARNLAFDVTPSELVTAIVTEKGVARAPFGESIRELMGLAAPEQDPSPDEHDGDDEIEDEVRVDDADAEGELPQGDESAKDAEDVDGTSDAIEDVNSPEFDASSDAQPADEQPSEAQPSPERAVAAAEAGGSQ